MMPVKARLRWFKAGAILLPVLLLLCAELVLRVFDYGHDTSLFVRDPDDASFYVMNPFASSIYFSDTVNATKGNIERFPVKKAPGALRIFVLGESTTAGYPYMHNGSFHRWLQYRLLHTFPDKEIEIINVSLTAVNSYTVLGFGRQVLDYQPDAVLVYAGHNEYYGALGVGSTSRIGGSRSLVRAMLWLRRFRLVQLLEGGIRYFRSSRSGSSVDTRENLMQRMAAEQTIPYGSPAYYAGVRQFRENMDALCRLYRDRRVPVFMSTLVSNERDQAPMIGGGSAVGRESEAGGDPGTADAQFRLGDSLYGVGDYVRAKAAFVQAKELDLLRFRAPDTLNVIIRQLCESYREGVHLVDGRSVFEAHSPHGILGRETLLEHVHPNLYGYALLSEAFYRSMKEAGILQGAADMTLDTLLRRMPVTRVDSLYGAYQVMMLKTRWPFHEVIPAGYVRGNSLEEQLAGALAVGRISWLDAMDQLFKYRLRTGDRRGALQAAEAVMLEHPENATYLAYCGRLSFEAGYPGEGVAYFKKLYRRDPSAVNARSLSMALYKLQNGIK
jgi:lysophospholipase L1-like esterase